MLNIVHVRISIACICLQLTATRVRSTCSNVHTFTHGWRLARHIFHTQANRCPAALCSRRMNENEKIKHETRWMTISSKSHTILFSFYSNQFDWPSTACCNKVCFLLFFIAKRHGLRYMYSFRNESSFSAMRIRVNSISAFVTFTNKSRWWRRCAYSCTAFKCFLASFVEHAHAEVDVDGLNHWFPSRRRWSQWFRDVPDIFDTLHVRTVRSEMVTLRYRLKHWNGNELPAILFNRHLLQRNAE